VTLKNNFLFMKQLGNTIWAPENKSIVDAYIRGYREALKNKHDYMIEMDDRTIYLLNYVVKYL